MADCERFHEGLLSEPANALSSLAYVAAGAWIWRHDRRQGAALMAVGVGSVAYHGPGGSVARWVHDATIVGVAALVLVAGPRIARGARGRPVLGVLTAGTFALALPLQLFGRTGGSLCRPDALLQAHAGWHVLTAAALAAAFALASHSRVAVDGHAAARIRVDPAAAGRLVAWRADRATPSETARTSRTR